MSVVFHRAISMIFPNIDTNRLALSEIDRADAEDVLGLFSSERVIEYYDLDAFRAILKTAFSGVLPCGPINRVQADTVPGNIASEALLRKVGFKEEGVRRQSGYWKNSFHDLKCFGLLRADFDGTSGFTLLDR
jgi:hypothetical protein